MIKIFKTTCDNLFFEEKVRLNENIDAPFVIINPNIKYQKHLGFGGALTEASCYIYSLLSNKQKEQVLSLLFKEEGLNYNYGRVTIGSCDFSLGMYDYFENDKLDYTHEDKYLFPFLNDIYKIKALNLFASSWSPPSRFKDNNSRLNGGKLKKEHYHDYASYLVNYCKMMKDRNYNLKAMSIQNEPEAKQVWDSCLFSPKEEQELALLLKGQLELENVDLDLYIWDHNRDVIVKRVQETLNNKKINNVIKGIAYHFYDQDCHQELAKLHKLYPDKNILFTEGCIELLLQKNGNDQYKNGLRYAKNYLLDSLNYSQGFIDWNVLLDSEGGPNHVGNFCEAPLMFNKKTKELIINPSYYAIKHFAHFIKENAYRIDVQNKTDVLITAYKNEDDSIVVVLLNLKNKQDINIKIDKININCCVDAFSIATILLSR